MLQEQIAGYCIVDKKGTPNGTRNPEKYLTGRRLRVMEFAEDGGAMVYAPDGTEIAMVESCDIIHKFKCTVVGDYILPENLKDDMVAKMVYIAKIESRRGGYAPILKEMIIAASLHRGYFTDNVLWAKQNEADAEERQKQARAHENPTNPVGKFAEGGEVAKGPRTMTLWVKNSMGKKRYQSKAKYYFV